MVDAACAVVAHVLADALMGDTVDDAEDRDAGVVGGNGDA